MTTLIPIVLSVFLVFFLILAGFAATILYTVARTFLLHRGRDDLRAWPLRPARRRSREGQRLVELQAIAALNQPD